MVAQVIGCPVSPGSPSRPFRTAREGAASPTPWRFRFVILAVGSRTPPLPTSPTTYVAAKALIRRAFFGSSKCWLQPLPQIQSRSIVHQYVKSSGCDALFDRSYEVPNPGMVGHSFGISSWLAGDNNNRRPTLDRKSRRAMMAVVRKLAAEYQKSLPSSEKTHL